MPIQDDDHYACDPSECPGAAQGEDEDDGLPPGPFKIVPGVGVIGLGDVNSRPKASEGVEHGLNVSSGSWLCKCGTWHCPEAVPAAKPRPSACPLHGAVLDCPDDCEGRTNAAPNSGSEPR